MLKFSQLYLKPQPKVQIVEKTEEYKAFHSQITGKSYHVSPSNAASLHDLKHGQTQDIEVAHHTGSHLQVKTYGAHRYHNTVHLHDDEGNHVDSFTHKRE